MTSDVRTIRDDEFGDFVRVVRTAMLYGPPSDAQVEQLRSRPHFRIDRCLGAFDDRGRLCGAARTFPTELTVPGGTVAAAAVSAVGVLPTHRRRGHFGRLMHTQLRDVAERGEPVALLIAAEYPIYGRYGYGPAIDASSVKVDSRHVSVLGEPSGAASLVDPAELATELNGLYERVRLAVPGHISLDPDWWRVTAGDEPNPDGRDDSRHAPTAVVWRDDGGQVQAAAAYTVDGRWLDNRPEGRVAVRTAVAATPTACRELLRYLVSIDWTTEVTLSLRPIDDPTPLLLDDGRAARLVDRSDHIWARIVDVPSALSARRYGCAGAVVIEVVDPLGLAGGRFRLEAGPDGACCTATDAEPDMVAPVGALGAAYLGGVGWARLAAAGWVEERTAGSIALASTLFATPRAPWSAVSF